jgi:hypothetical protein
MASVSPTVLDVARELGVPVADVRRIIAARTLDLESWASPDRPGEEHVMLSAHAARRQSLTLDAGGRRWIPASA